MNARISERNHFAMSICVMPMKLFNFRFETLTLYYIIRYVLVLYGKQITMSIFLKRVTEVFLYFKTHFVYFIYCAYITYSILEKTSKILSQSFEPISVQPKDQKRRRFERFTTKSHFSLH